jgi:DNA polymerase (family 10)
MFNQELAKILYEIGYFLEMEEIPFKPYAYQKVAILLDTLERDVKEIYKTQGVKGLEKIPGIGKNIAEKIEEYIKTGRIKYYQQLKKKMPVKIEELMAIEGIGVKTIKAFYKNLRVKDIDDLEKAAKAGKIKRLFGFQEKTEQNILQGIAFLKRSKGRFLLGEILPQVKKIIEQLNNLKEVERINTAGSVRRMKETIGDVDILITIKGNQKSKFAQSTDRIMETFVSMPGVVKVWGRGPTRSSVRMKQIFDVDLRVVPEQSCGSALQYFTGSKEHNIALRKIAIKKEMKLNEYGLFREKKRIAGETEEQVYNALGMVWIPPEMRKNQGEIEMAIAKKLPKIIEYDDIKGDLHCHTKWSDGSCTIKDMAKSAQDMGYEYLGITDHTKFLKIENGLNEKRLLEQKKEIDKLNKKFPTFAPAGASAWQGKFQILQGAETNILNDGSIDINDNALKKLDYAIAGIHSNFKMPKQEMTERIIKAIKNPHIHIIAHPTGRILKKRDRYQCDFDKILRAAKQYGKILEINAQPRRLDLNDQHIRQAKEMGVKMVINSDSHHKSHFKFMEFGIAQARRGWAEKKDIINTMSLPLSKLFK